MTLDGNGNLKLYDADKKWHWQSFLYPTTTWLPGQRLHIHKQLISTVSPSNLSTGNFGVTLSPESIQVFLNLSIAQPYQAIQYDI